MDQKKLCPVGETFQEVSSSATVVARMKSLTSLLMSCSNYALKLIFLCTYHLVIAAVTMQKKKASRTRARMVSGLLPTLQYHARPLINYLRPHINTLKSQALALIKRAGSALYTLTLPLTRHIGRDRLLGLINSPVITILVLLVFVIILHIVVWTIWLLDQAWYLVRR